MKKDPTDIIAAAGVTGGVSLLGGLLENWFEAEQQKRKAIMEAKNQGFESHKKATDTLHRGQQDALGELLASYGRSLL